jgi:hypothetical protein
VFLIWKICFFSVAGALSVFQEKVFCYKDCNSINIILRDSDDTEGVQENLPIFGFRRIEHPPYSPDFASCHFFQWNETAAGRATF